jgi:hypothetical protein
MVRKLLASDIMHVYNVSLSQANKQEEIWGAAKAGDEARLRQFLVGATAEEFKFEKVSDEVRFRKYTFWLFP